MQILIFGLLALTAHATEISGIPCADTPRNAAFSLVSRLAANPPIAKMSLQEVYALPMADVENHVLAKDKEVCDGLVSAYVQGETDPAKLSAAEFCAVLNYSNGAYSISRPLWTTPGDGSGLTGDQWAYVRVLDAALAKLPKEPATVVYSGTGKHMPLPKVGETVRLRGYTSTSPNREVAEGFTKDRMLVIKTISGRNIKNYSNAGMEDEFLLPRSTYVRLDKVEVKEMEIFTEEGPEMRKVEFVHLTEIAK